MTARPRRARSALLWGIVAFVALQAGLTLAVEGGLTVLRDPDYACHDRTLRRHMARRAADAPFVLFVGSSRTVVGIKASDLEAQLGERLHKKILIHNFGLVGAGPLTQLLAVKRLLAESVHPDLVVLEVLPPFLAGQSSVSHIEMLRLPATRLTLSELALLNSYDCCTHSLKRNWWGACLFPWYERRVAILSRIMPTSLPETLRLDYGRHMDGAGWVPHVAPASPEIYRWAVDRTHKEYGAYFAGFEVGDPAGRAIREILQACRDNQIAVGLILMPEGSPFRSWYTAETWQRMKRYLDSLSIDYEAPIINARDWLPDQFFFDSHHLHADGAAELTRLLSQDATLQGLVRDQCRLRSSSTRRAFPACE